MKWLAVSLIAALLLLQYRLWLSGDGVREVWRLRSAVAVQQSENTRLLERNRQLGAEVHDLKQGYAALEERARSDLGMVAGNETFYQVVPPRPSGSAPSGVPAAVPVTPPQRTAAAH
jgi:cell division protein FtsB